MQPLIIILNWNGWDDSLACLRSLCDCADVGEVWLVDNGSVTDKSEECRRALPKLRVLMLAHNYGWAGAYNRALQAAAKEGYETAFLLNNDTTVQKGFLAAARDLMAKDAQLAAVGSLIAYDDKVSVKFDGSYHQRGTKQLCQSDSGEPWFVSEVNGAGMLVRMKALRTNGYFDERFFCYGEETEWCWRMLQQGWLLAVASSSLIYHKGEATNVNANAHYYRYRNRFLLLEGYKDRVPWRGKAHLALDTLRVAERCWSTANRETFSATLAALRDGLAGHFGPRKEEPPGLAWMIAGLAYTRVASLRRKLFACVLHDR
jgi:GT2 family glycosyltransferase